VVINQKRQEVEWPSLSVLWPSASDLRSDHIAIERDGRATLSSGATRSWQVGKNAKLADAGETKPGEFWVFITAMAGPVYVFEMPCRVYRLEAAPAEMWTS
jgi:hypothetical protein